MFKQFVIQDNNSKDLKIEFCGHHVCEKNHTYGPSVRDIYLLHFCIKGKGTITDKYGKHNVKSGEFFIIRPNEVTTYTADNNEPWEYVWLAFSGEHASVFNDGLTVSPCDKEITIELLNLVNGNVVNQSAYKSLIYKVIYNVYGKQSYSIDVVSKIKQYIRFNYMEDLSLTKLSSVFGFERTYLYRMFKNSVGISIKEYIINTRMTKAKAFLEKGYNVNTTSSLVGYNDPFNFSKAYKKYYGISPAASNKKPC